MGISGLLKGLGCYTQKGCNVRDFSGQALAVDASSWLHKSVYSISERFVETTEASGTNTLDATCVQTSTNYIVKRCQELLQHAHIASIYLVMDGVRCPLKAETNRDRDQRRHEHLTEARHYRQQGNGTKAEDKYKMCIKIRADFAQAVLQAVERRLSQTSTSAPQGSHSNNNHNNNHNNHDHNQSNKRVICVWAPYEADAQLVKLCWDGLANAIVTEDSDVLLYLATCRVSVPILFKLDRDTGSCDVVSMDWLLKGSMSSTKHLTQRASVSQTPTTAASTTKKATTLETILKGLAAREERRPGVGVRQFVQACVLAGCDYAPSCLNGIGLVTAFKLVQNQAHRSPSDCFRYVLSALPKTAFGTTVNRDDYELLLSKSEAVFYYHPVVDPKRRVDHLVLPPSNLDSPLQHEDSLTESLPSLTRFDDVSFLGSLDIVPFAPEMNNNNIFAKPPTPQHAPKRQQQHAFAIQHLQLTTTTTIPKSHGCGPHNHLPKTTATTAIAKKTLFNPYLAAKRPRPGANTAKAPPSKKANHRSDDRKSNPFAKFSLEKENVKPPPKSSLEILFQHDSQDVRFVKRQFPKIGREEPTNKVGDTQSSAEANGITSQAQPPSKSESNRATTVGSNRSQSSPEQQHKNQRNLPETGVLQLEIDEDTKTVAPRKVDNPERVPHVGPPVATTSKFFQSIPRRVTLDSTDLPPSQSETWQHDDEADSTTGDGDQVFSNRRHPKEEEMESIEPIDSFDYGSPLWRSNGAPTDDKSTERPSSTITQDLRHLVAMASPIVNCQVNRNQSFTKSLPTNKGITSRNGLLANRVGSKRQLLPLRSPKLLFQPGNIGLSSRSRARANKTLRGSKRKATPTSSDRKQGTLHRHFPLVIQD